MFLCKVLLQNTGWQNIFYIRFKMVVCKFFQQNNCRNGQYCKFEHSFGNRSKIFNNPEKPNICLVVAEDVVAAERGGQWLLSCYGPFKEKPSIPEMEDFSPEEVRWEMYQAQKTGTVDQVKQQFQQLCEAMKVKRDALKNPSPAIASILEKLQNTGSETNKSNFLFASPQFTPTSTTSNSNIFGQNTFGSANNSSNVFTSSASSIFNRPSNPSTNSVFGAKPVFGSGNVFGGSSATNASIFGGSSSATSTAFGGTQNTQTFGSVASQRPSVFGGSTNQSSFGQAPVFGGNSQTNTTNNSFLKPQTAQNSVFGGGSVFSANTNNIFGSISTSNNVFGTAVSTPTTAGNSGVFGQQATNANFATPVFGGSANYSQLQNTLAFNNQSTFGSPMMSSPNVFGNSNTATATFGPMQQNTNAFSPTPVSTNTFGAVQNSPSHVSMSTNNISSPFGSTGNTFGGTNAFSNSLNFSAQDSQGTNNTFGKSQGFENSNNQTTSIFTSNTPITSVTSLANSPFLQNTKIQIPNPFGVSPSQNLIKSSANVANNVCIDETAFSLEENLTDDEKAAYSSEKFSMGKIPMNPPTKELR